MRKFLISSIVFFTILFSFFSITFAATDLVKDAKNTTNMIEKSMSNTANGAKNAIHNGENMVANGMNQEKNMIVDSTKNTMNYVENGFNGVMGHMDNDHNNYNATRTAANTGFLGMTSNTWTWVILAIVGLAIVGLVWYYGAQYEHSDYSDGE